MNKSVGGLIKARNSRDQWEAGMWAQWPIRRQYSLGFCRHARILAYFLVFWLPELALMMVKFSVRSKYIYSRIFFTGPWVQEEWAADYQSEASIQVMRSLSTNNQMPVHMIILDQSDASIMVTWSLLTNQRRGMMSSLWIMINLGK